MSAPQRLRLGPLQVDLRRQLIHGPSGDVGLTTMEATLLTYLAARRGTAVSRAELYQEVWGYSTRVRSRTLDVTVRRLRQKIEPDPRSPRYLRTVPRLGYLLEVDADETIAAPRTNLPADVTSFVGREDELAGLDGLMDADQRCVVLVGPPGVGKTRLARTWAAERTAETPGGVWRVALDPVRDADGIRAAVATALDVPLTGADADADTARLGRALGGRGPLLLILDTCEGCADALPDLLGAWLDAAPDLRVVATSRTRIPHDHAWHVDVGPLALPDAVRLFEARAAMVRREARLTPAERPLVEAIADRLDRIPLALELAAARVSTLSPRDVLARLDRRFSLLGGTSGAPTDRSATLHAAIGWSWELMEPADRQALMVCSVFVGGTTAALWGRVAEPPLAVDQAEARLRRLVRQSLVRPVGVQSALGSLRYATYESVRAFAAARLDETGQAPAIALRHAHAVVEHAESLAARLDLRGGESAAQQLRGERDNLEAACDRALSSGDPALAARAIDALGPVYRLFGPLHAFVPRVDRVLQTATDLPPALLARLHHRRAGALRMSRGSAAMVDDLARARDLAQAAGDTHMLAKIQADVGIGHMDRGELGPGLAAMATAVELARAAGSTPLEGRVRSHLGVLLLQAGERDRSQTELEQALALHQQVGNLRQEGTTLTYLAFIALDDADLARAAELFERSAARHAAGGDTWSAAISRGYQGTTALERGEVDAARRAFTTAVQQLAALGDRPFVALFEGNLGLVHHLEGRLQQAEQAYRAAVRGHRLVGDRRVESAMLCWLAAVEAEQDLAPQARRTLDRAGEMLAQVGDPALLTLHDAVALLLDLCQGPRDRVDPGLDARLQALEQGDGAAAGQDLRFVLRRLRALRPRTGSAGAG